MTWKRALCMVALLALFGTSTGLAQQQTGEIFGRVTDSSGAVLPGTTVTVTGPTLLQPRIATTSATGSYSVPELPIGRYSVSFELPGFRGVVREEIRITIGFSAQINAELAVSTVEETVTVTGESPLIDTRETGTKTAFDLEALQNLPSARDPWVMLERTPGVVMDRVNVGGNQSGQQSGFISRGAAGANNKWSMDGVDITDMSATGASPGYYDFDMLEEMQVTTGGADASQQTGGVGINLVTKSGTDRLRGQARFLITDEEFQSDNVTEELREQGAGSGSPIQNIKDYGFEVGGPIKPGRAWYWGSYSTQDVKVGVVGFYKDTPTCRPTPPTDTDGLRGCLESDLTTLNNYNWKVQTALFTGNKLTFQNSWAQKERSARDASDLRPIETTYRQKYVDSQYGATGWLTGPNPFWKVSDQHVFNDRWLVDVTWAHNGNNFVLDFNEDSLADVQPRFETSTSAYSRSFQQSIFLRPTNSVDVVTNYFLPGALGGDHAFKAGVRWRSAHTTSLNHRGGNAYARFTDGVPNSADLWRDGNQEYHLNTWGAFVQDSYTIRRLTLNLGARVDIQSNEALATSIAANPIAPAILPAIDFPGIDGPVTWTNFSPRLGVTYDLTGSGRSIATASFATYYGQMSPDQLVSDLVATGAVSVRYPWNDQNGDEFVQADEIDFSDLLSRSSSYDPDNPGNFLSPGTVDPDIKNDRTRELIVGVDHQLAGNLAVGGSYIWRKYDDFNREDILGFSSADMRAVEFTPTCTVADARCETITYFEPSFPVPAPYLVTNTLDRYRDFNGVELTAMKRYSDRWSASFSYAFNNAVDHWDSEAAIEDPTPRTTGGFNSTTYFPGSAQYAPESGGSGIGNVFQNAKWLTKLSGQYTFPWDINMSGVFQARQGFPTTQTVQTPNRANSGGQIQVPLDTLGDLRLQALRTFDLRIDRSFAFGRARLRPSLDIFNIGNVNTVLARRPNQRASNANTVSGIVAPRVLRFGLRVEW